MLAAPLQEIFAERPAAATHVATLIGMPLTAESLEDFSALLDTAGWRVLGARWLSLADTERGCLELSLAEGRTALADLHEPVISLADKHVMDIALQTENARRQRRRLAVFDMDSTLIDAEVIDELAGAAGVRDEVSAVTERAMRGEIDFGESFRARLGTLRGLGSERLEDIAAGLRLNDGAEPLFATLRYLGIRTAILSGGFDFFAKGVQARLGIDEVHANALDIVDGMLTGEVRGEIVDGTRKALLLRELAAREGLTPDHVIAVGDGANDLLMLEEAGLGVAFRAKPVVRRAARQAINRFGLDCVLFLLGVPERDWLDG